MKTSYNNCFA